MRPHTVALALALVAVNGDSISFERGQLGRSNGCDATPMTSVLTLP